MLLTRVSRFGRSALALWQLAGTTLQAAVIRGAVAAVTRGALIKTCPSSDRTEAKPAPTRKRSLAAEAHPSSTGLRSSRRHGAITGTAIPYRSSSRKTREFPMSPAVKRIESPESDERRKLGHFASGSAEGPTNRALNLPQYPQSVDGGQQGSASGFDQSGCWPHRSPSRYGATQGEWYPATWSARERAARQEDGREGLGSPRGAIQALRKLPAKTKKALPEQRLFCLAGCLATTPEMVPRRGLEPPRAFAH